MLLTDILSLFSLPFVLGFSSPKAPAVAPMPANPVEDPEAIAQREATASAAAVDLVSGGRRSTMFAGRETAQREQIARGRKRLGYASDDLLV